MFFNIIDFSCMEIFKCVLELIIITVHISLPAKLVFVKKMQLAQFYLIQYVFDFQSYIEFETGASLLHCRYFNYLMHDCGLVLVSYAEIGLQASLGIFGKLSDYWAR